MAFRLVAPIATVTPPVSVADRQHGPGTRWENPQGYALMRHYQSRKQSCTVYLLYNGVPFTADLTPMRFSVDPQPDVPVTILIPLGFTVVTGQPYPATRALWEWVGGQDPNTLVAPLDPSKSDVPNQVLNNSWYDGQLQSSQTVPDGSGFSVVKVMQDGDVIDGTLATYMQFAGFTIISD